MNQLLLTLSTLLLGILSVASVQAQMDYRPGYIITNANDTIRGYILYKDFGAANTCTFKKELADKASDYVPADIMGFRFEDGKYFISKQTSTNEGDKLYFLEYIIRGKANIYFRKDENEHYYIETDSKKIVELTEPTEVINITDKGDFEKPKQFKGKLTYMLSDCPAVFPEIYTVKLSISSLSKLAKNYQSLVCPKQQCEIFERKSKSIKIRWGVKAGVSNNQFEFDSDLYTDYSIARMISCNVAFENVFFASEHSSLELEAILQHFGNYPLKAYEGKKFTFVYNYHPYTINSTNPGALKNNVYALKIPCTYKYTFLKSKLRPFVALGIMYMYISQKNCSLEISSYKIPFNTFIPKHHYGYVGKVGSKYVLDNNHSINLEVTYEATQNLFMTERILTKRKDVSLSIGYTY